LGGFRLLVKWVEPELEQVELVFVAPPARRQSCCSTFSPATVWSHFTFRVFGRAPAGAAGGAGVGALPNRPKGF